MTMAASRKTDYLGWVLQLGRVEFERCLEWQRGLVKLRREGMARDIIIMVEHPPVVTIGKDGHSENYESLKQQPYFIERGGDVTYHGPGQLVIYFIFNLARRGRDIHDFMARIQDGIIQTLATIDIEASKGKKHTGVWVAGQKIASIGIAVKNWISFHGAAVNLNTDLTEFEQINPCGLEADVMTSAEKLLNRKVDMKEFGRALLEAYGKIFSTDFYDVQLEEIAEDIESQAGGNVI